LSQAGAQTTLDVVRGRLDEPAASEVLEFWAQRGFTGEPARQRLPEVVCLLRCEGRIAGVSSAFPADLELVGGRRFWIYRSLLPPEVADHAEELIRATFDALDAEPHDPPDHPIGLCLLLDARQRRQLPPEAEWLDPRIIYAGYVADGRQVRVGYFSDQVSSMAGSTAPNGMQPDPGYRIEPFSVEDRTMAEAVVELWTKEGALSPAEAQRRVSEVRYVVTDEQNKPAAIATTYLARSDQLRADFWYFRTFTAAQHRKANIAVSLVQTTRDHLEQRYVSGEDRRAMGFIMEIENEGLRRTFPKPLWFESDVLLVGENARGAYVLVHYFPGARAPEPDVYA
jgi:hypothetical protein